MRKLFTCLYGSSLYGTTTPDSDRDVKHIVLPDIGDLLLGKTVKNVVNKTNKDSSIKNGADDVDDEVIPIQIFARDFLEGQTYALELAFAVDGKEAEQTFYEGSGATKGYVFRTFCRELRTKFLTSSIKGMMGYAVNQAELYSNKGERLNAARELHHTLNLYMYYPAMKIQDADEQFHSIVKAYSERYPSCIAVTTYDQDGKGNIQRCINVLGRILPYTSSVMEARNTVQKIISRYGARAKAASATNVDWKATMHAYRVIDEGVGLLQTKTMTFPFSKLYADFLLEMKRGELSYEWVKETITDNMGLLTKLEATSDLPKLTPELRQQHEAWLLGWLKELYL